MELNGKEILDRVLFLLNKKGIKQCDFFKSIGSSTQMPTHWRRGIVPSLEIVCDMAQALNVSTDWLIKGTECEDTYDDTSFGEILKRIDETISNRRKKASLPSHNYDDGFYSSIEDLINPADFDNYVYGRQYISRLTLYEIAKRLQVSYQYLITGEEISKEEYKSSYSSFALENDGFYNSYHCLNEDKQAKAQQYVYDLFKVQLYENEQKQKLLNKEDK